MNSEELEAKIDAYLDELAASNFKNLENLEKLLVSEFVDNAEEADFSIWTDVFRDHLENIETELIRNGEFRKFLINIGVIDTHIICGGFYVDEIENLYSPDELDRIADLPLCEEDSGRSDSCFGAHFFITLQPNISEKTLRKLLSIDHYDIGFFPWLVSRSKSATSKLLAELAEKFTYTTTWRAGGDYNNGDSLIDKTVETFVLWSIINNPNTSQATLKKFEAEISQLRNASEEDLQALIEIYRPNSARDHMEKLKTFEGDTSYLDGDFLKWLEVFYTAAVLIDDLFEEVKELEYENDEKFKQLQSLWLAAPDRSKVGVSESNSYWHLAGVRIPIEVQKIEGAEPSFIDLLYVELSPPISKGFLGKKREETPTGRWKVSILRTGGSDEYQESTIKDELAWKMMVVANGQKIELSMVEGEVIWVRSLQYNHPLNDLSPQAIEKLAENFIKRSLK
jgi:hypothetical protein